MSLGIFRHSLFGQTKIYTENESKIMESKQETAVIIKWINWYEEFKKYKWNHCLVCTSLKTEEEQDPANKKKMKSMTTIFYEPFLITLKDQILNRAKRKMSFDPEEILYILYKIALGWEQWDHFTKETNIPNFVFAISSEHILFNQYGEIKFVSPFSSPFPPPKYTYPAPENLPPNQEKPEFWNKSISFSIGLIGAQLLTLKLAGPFYLYNNGKIKFSFEEFNKWFSQIEQFSSSEISRIIGLLVDQNPWVRMNLGELLALLNPYKKQILQMESFTLSQKKCESSLMEYELQHPRKFK